jgi:mercuric ion transport protein
MQSRVQAGGLLGYLSLFTSVGTLLCCALPALFVLLGLGATVASVVSSAPWLITLSRHKNWTFTIAGLLIAANFFYVFLIAPRLRATTAESCPVDQPNACGSASRVSRWILWFSAGVYLVGFFSAYLLGPILRYFG